MRRTFMLRRMLIVFGSMLVLTAMLLGLVSIQDAQALPEYSAQTGEPCATCHLSPSGGGPRGPRGQAWVASSKPGAVPDLVQSLEVLGIELDVDLSLYTTAPASVPAPAPLQSFASPGIQPSQAERLNKWLNVYGGN